MFNCVQTKILRGISPILLHGRLNLRTSEVQQSSNKVKRKFCESFPPILAQGRLNLRTSEVQQSSKKVQIKYDLKIKISQGVAPIMKTRAPKFYDF